MSAFVLLYLQTRTNEYILGSHVTCIDQSISNLLRSNFKFSLHIRAESPSKKLNFIHVDVQKKGRKIAVSRISEQIKKVTWARNSFYLTPAKCSRHVRYIIIVISVWFYGYSKYSEMNVYIEGGRNCSE